MVFAFQLFAFVTPSNCPDPLGYLICGTVNLIICAFAKLNVVAEAPNVFSKLTVLLYVALIKSSVSAPI